MKICPACGLESPDGFRFCGTCGALLDAAPPPRELRKVVTIVFCDLTGSTELGDRTDPEALRATMRGYYERMRLILERHGGTVEKFVGDAVMAVFGVPIAHEDDALRAVRAAWEMRAAVATLQLQARIGVNTGEVVAGEGDTLVTGDAVNVAARLEQAAEPGELLIGDETRRLVRDAVIVEPVEVSAKGKRNPVSAFRVVELDVEASGVARRLDTLLVGRVRELSQLRQAYERVVSEQACHLFTLLGAAGVGKSRLTAEFLNGLDATVARGRCLDYGDGITFWPVIEILKQLGADEAVDAIASGSVAASALFPTVRKALEQAAHERPLVVVFDDIHWGEPTFLDLLDHVTDLSRGAPILLLCIARPELLDERPGWGGGKLNASTALLQPLTADESAELLDTLGAEKVEPDTRARILQSAEGNPLFVEEMLALALEGGDVRAPSTIHALLQARLDRLGAAERVVIERGAVEGELFHRGAVRQLLNGSGDGIDSELIGLVRKELIRPDQPTFPGDDAYRFRHLLIRDAAYDALPKETRADLHRRFADWLESHVDLVELDEIVGYHLEQAARYANELGRPDPVAELAAARRLTAAGWKASGRADLPAAENLLGRAVALMPPDDPSWPATMTELIAVLEQRGAQRRVELIDELERHPDERARTHGHIARSQMRLSSDPHAAVDEARRVATRALDVFITAGDDVGLARTWYLLFFIDWLRSRGAPALESLERAIDHARRAGSHALVNNATLFLLGPLTHGPMTPDEIRARLEPLRADGGPIVMTAVLRCDSHLLSLDGRFDEALERHEQAAVLAEEAGLSVSEAVMSQWPAELMLLQGRVDEGIRTLTEANAQLERLGETSFRSTVLVYLADALYQAGSLEDAERLSIEGEELGAEEDVVNFALGRGTRARVAADRGEHQRADELAEDAVRYAYETDFWAIQAGAHEARAHSLAAAGRTGEAQAELEHALSLYETYGSTFRAKRVRDLLVKL